MSLFVVRFPLGELKINLHAGYCKADDLVSAVVLPLGSDVGLLFSLVDEE